MGRRLGWVGAAAALALAYARLGRLLDTGDGANWQRALVVAVVLGAGLVLAARFARLSGQLVALLTVVGMAIAMLRVAVPETLLLGVLPTLASWSTLSAELGFAFELVRFGSAPVVPVAGLTAALVTLFWGMGALAAWGAAEGRPLLAAAAPVGFYLQLATFDRFPPGRGWTLAFAAVAALVLVAAGWRPAAGTGRARRSDGNWVPRHHPVLPPLVLATAVAAAYFVSSGLAAAVPESGTLHWRSNTGIGAGLYGGVSYNLFAGLQQDIVSNSSEPVFVARVSESAPPQDQLYWRMITLDTFDGTNWLPDEQTFSRPQEGGRWERDDWRFQGPTVRVEQVVQIRSLRQNYLPLLYSPVALTSDESVLNDTFRVREDGSIKFDARTFPGLTYRVTSDVPVPDLSVLASLDGTLSPIFREASEAGVFPVTPVDITPGATPPELDAYLSLPTSVGAEVRNLAREVVAGGSTRFEQALLLEAFFRDPELFTYDAGVSTGHSSLDLADWLLDEESRNYRTGYCEQFATAMAVMARTLGLPSRVALGFTPGELVTAEDGSELIVVRQRNAHAWVEVWFSGQGWVRFDPTPRSDATNPALLAAVGFDPRAFLPQPDEPGSVAVPDSRFFDPRLFGDDVPNLGIDPSSPDLPPVENPDAARGVPFWVWVAVGAAALASAVPLVKLARRRRRLARLRHGDITAAWEEIVDRLRDLGTGVEPHETPLELAERVGMGLSPVAAAYTQVVYGPPQRAASRDGVQAFQTVERRIRQRYRLSRRLRAWVHPRSLLRR